MSHATVLVVLDPCPESDIEEKVKEQMEPFDENGEWVRDGSRWDWWVIGGRYEARLLGRDYIRRKEVDLDQMMQDELARYTRYYREYQKTMEKEPEYKWGELVYGVKPDETLHNFLERSVDHPFPGAFAFLRNRIWQEKERMGWFGGSFKTECEIAGEDVHICVYENKELNSKIVSWQNNDSFDKNFYKRFVEPVDSECWLVMVDYHV